MRHSTPAAARRAAAAVGALVAAVLAVCLALTVGTTASAAGSPAAAGTSADAQARADKLRGQVAELRSQRAAAVSAYQRLHDELATVVPAGLLARQHAGEARSAARQQQETAANRVRALYMSGGQLALYGTVLNADTPAEALARFDNLQAVLAGDRALVARADAAAAAAAVAEVWHADAARRQLALERRAAEQAAAVEQLLAHQQRLLDGADAEVRRLLDEERRAAAAAAARALAAELARQRTAAAQLALGAVTDSDRAALAQASAEWDAATPDGDVGPATTAGLPQLGGPRRPAPGARYTCPVGPVHHFIDSWGAPRSGGRSHQGTDVFTPFGAPAYAVADGVIDKVSDIDKGLGGITVWLRTAEGDRFYYAHNAVNLVPLGQRVRAGDVIARVGRTGNAATTPPHIHFEMHPGGGPAVNPFPFLDGLCG